MNSGIKSVAKSGIKSGRNDMTYFEKMIQHQVYDRVSDRVRIQVWDQVHDQVCEQVHDQVRIQDRDQVRKEIA